jgi:hypothetical protein
MTTYFSLLFTGKPVREVPGEKRSKNAAAKKTPFWRQVSLMVLHLNCDFSQTILPYVVY